MSELLQAALDYAQRGVPVFPCRSDDKTPLTAHGFKDASREPKQIEAWWRQWPDAMIAAPTGEALGAWVLDIDDEAAFEGACAARDIVLPATRSATSGKGRHLYFKWDPADPIRNTQQHPKRGWPFPDLPGAETRGDGGYIILPPSVHPSGRTYEWLRDEDSSEAPDDLLSIIRAGHPKEQQDPRPAENYGQDTPYGLAALEAECEAVRSAGAGAQECALNEGALKMGGLVAGGWLSWSTAIGRLIGAGLTMTSHDPKAPWTPQNVTVKVEHSMRDGMRSPRGPADNERPPPEPGASEADQITATPYAWRDPSTLPMRPWVYGHWLLRQTATEVVAGGGTGKTTLMAGTALSLITGRSLLGKTVWEGPKRVWLWNLEDPLEELQRCFQAAAKFHGLEAADIEGRLFVDTAMDGSPLCTAVEVDGAFKLHAPVYAGITAELIRRQIDVLIIDPFVSSHEVDENANSKIDKIAKAWGRVANDANCSIVLVHHVSKAGAKDVTALSSRGGVALSDACRVVLVLNRMDEATAERFGFDDKERRRHFNVQDDKHNRAPPENADWYRLESVDLGNGGQLGPGDSVGAATPWTLPDPFEGLTGNHLYTVQLAIDAADWRENHQATAWAGVAVAQALNLKVDDRKDRSRIIQLLKRWVQEGALVVEEGQDKARKTVKFLRVGKWQNDASA